MAKSFVKEKRPFSNLCGNCGGGKKDPFLTGGKNHHNFALVSIRYSFLT